ncbi:hypothetical protein TIFTF001_053753 [Ficus carica]|uniref:Uncharacterized protein n=1 Tax=Ficus carica TaxID=3494 RepID=A0AA88EFE6_FICCA|nr:hypothetical protein TIFTF001_053753 [Ficus carica]
MIAEMIGKMTDIRTIEIGVLIVAVIGNHTMHHILVGNESSVDILYHGAFTKMGLTWRPNLRVLKMVTSIYYQTMKFPTARRIRQVKGNQYESRTTYMDAIHDYVEAQLCETLRLKNRMVLIKPLDIDLDRCLDDDKLGIRLVEYLIEI